MCKAQYPLALQLLLVKRVLSNPKGLESSSSYLVINKVDRKGYANLLSEGKRSSSFAQEYYPLTCKAQYPLALQEDNVNVEALYP